jgi:hypothetical protein
MTITNAELWNRAEARMAASRARYAQEQKQADACELSQKKLNKAFAQLRREGLLAKQRFSCCRSCGGSELATIVTDIIDAGGDRPKGVVFFSKQEGFRGASVHEPKFRRLYLSFGSVTTKYGDVGLPTVEVGQMIAKALTEVGLTFEWDGSPDSTIVVDPCPGMWPA